MCVCVNFFSFSTWARGSLEVAPFTSFAIFAILSPLPSYSKDAKIYDNKPTHPVHSIKCYGGISLFSGIHLDSGTLSCRNRLSFYACLPRFAVQSFIVRACAYVVLFSRRFLYVFGSRVDTCSLNIYVNVDIEPISRWGQLFISISVVYGTGVPIVDEGIGLEPLLRLVGWWSVLLDVALGEGNPQMVWLAQLEVVHFLKSSNNKLSTCQSTASWWAYKPLLSVKLPNTDIIKHRNNLRSGPRQRRPYWASESVPSFCPWGKIWMP